MTKQQFQKIVSENKHKFLFLHLESYTIHPMSPHFVLYMYLKDDERKKIASARGVYVSDKAKQLKQKYENWAKEILNLN